MRNNFSSVYDALTFDIDYEGYAQKIKQLLFIQGLRPKTVLEFGGGTGNLTEELYEEGTDYDFVDLDSEMLAAASAKDFASGVHFYHADILDFPMEKAYDLVLGNLNVVNYFTDKEKASAFFSRVKKHLTKNGLFLFDMNSPYKLRKIQGNETFVYERDNIFYTWENRLREPFIDYFLDFFVEENGLYRRFSEDFTERIYEVGEMEEMLREAGFKNIKTMDYDTGKSIGDETMRILWILPDFY